MWAKKEDKLVLLVFFLFEKLVIESVPVTGIVDSSRLNLGLVAQIWVEKEICDEKEDNLDLSGCIYL